MGAECVITHATLPLHTVRFPVARTKLECHFSESFFLNARAISMETLTESNGLWWRRQLWISGNFIKLTSCPFWQASVQMQEIKWNELVSKSRLHLHRCQSNFWFIKPCQWFWKELSLKIGINWCFWHVVEISTSRINILSEGIKIAMFLLDNVKVVFFRALVEKIQLMILGKSYGISKRKNKAKSDCCFPCRWRIQWEHQSQCYIFQKSLETIQTLTAKF